MIIVDQLRVSNDLLDFLCVHLLAHVRHRVCEFTNWDLTIMVTVEHFQGINNILKWVRVFSSMSNQIFQTWQVELARTVWVYFLHHLNNLSFGRIEVNRSDEGSQLLRPYKSTWAFVEEAKYFFDFIGLNVRLVNLVALSSYHCRFSTNNYKAIIVIFK